MSAVSSLVPARFLTLTAHLVIVITIFWSRENNVEACLPLDFTQDQYDKEDTKLVVALSVTMGLFAIELAGFFSGVSMFNCTQGLLSLAVHLSPCLSLSSRDGSVGHTGLFLPSAVFSLRLWRSYSSSQCSD
ncbi:transmembrane protein 107 isoform X2 [Salmo salar]|uniref:Transmembrane protein 107 n=1 Tax=Salmo salar TaxID=8030 RepID=A0A1S3RXQ9_SALSA|nr:transmembrane protein 107 isoform X2 [Salmo salar]|eukprot:XP_014057028.1 PREDICTED: transmembrane protein 107 isoform X2 [Salmo salar]